MPSLGLGDAFDTVSGLESSAFPKVVFFPSGDETTDKFVRTALSEGGIHITDEKEGVISTPVLMVRGTYFNGITEIEAYIKKVKG